MTVDHRQVTEMSRLIGLLNGNGTPEPIVANTPPANQCGDSNVNAMRDILQRFQTVSSGVEAVTETLVTETARDHSLRAAMMTEESEDGVRIGPWEIRVKTATGRKMYDVVHEDDDVIIIASDLTLYEAAYGIANALAQGKPITTPFFRDLLAAEGDFASALHDAIHFRHALRKPLHETRRAVLEDRYDAAKRKAAIARRRVETLVGDLPS